MYILHRYDWSTVFLILFNGTQINEKIIMQWSLPYILFSSVNDIWEENLDGRFFHRMENSIEQQDYLIPAKVLLNILYIRKRTVLNSMAVLIQRAVIFVHHFCSLFLKTMKETTLMATYMTPPLFYFHNKPSEVEYTKG